MRSPSPVPPQIPGLSQPRNGAKPLGASRPTGSAAPAPIKRWWRLLFFAAVLLANFLLIQLFMP